MGDFLDRDAQPSANFNVSRNAKRSIDELLGLCKGVMADGIVSHTEAEFLLAWLRENDHVHDVWPTNILVARFEQILEDGIIDDQELLNLAGTIKKMIGGDQPVYGHKTMLSTQLPLDDPQPQLLIEGKEFCFTGKFVFGSRKRCQEAVIERGGICNSNPRQTTDYLIIGAIGSRDWVHSSFGRKIERAVELKDDSSSPIAIIAEEHWAEHL